MSKYDYIFSLGYRCTSAGILKSLGLKAESYPFDWMVSRLPIIEHCVKNDFVEFLNQDNYTNKTPSATYDYPTKDPESRQWICDESIRINEFYRTPTIGSMHLHLAPYLNVDHDAYSHHLMMNHHDITEEKDHEYYKRCINRWLNMRQSSGKKLSLYIHPTLFLEHFNQIREDLQAEIRKFHRLIFKVCNPSLGGTNDEVYDGIYIIPVKTPYDYPTHHCAKYVLEEQPDDAFTPNCRICILWTNPRFIDAGEIFMGDCSTETYVVTDYIRIIAESGQLPLH
jgi:hypothetical protein